MFWTVFFLKKRNKKYFDVILQNHFFFHFHVREKNLITIQSFIGKKELKFQEFVAANRYMTNPSRKYVVANKCWFFSM